MQEKLWRYMSMSGQMTRYKESLKHTPEPITLRQIQGKTGGFGQEISAYKNSRANRNLLSEFPAFHSPI